LEQKNLTLTTKLETLLAQHASLQCSLNESQELLRSTSESLQLKGQQLETLTSQLRDLDALYQTEKTQCGELRNQNETLSSQYSNLVEQHAQVQTQSQLDLKRLETQLEEERTRESLRNENYMSLQSDFSEKNRSLIDCERIISELRNEIESCQSANTLLEERVNSCQLERSRERQAEEVKVRNLEVSVQNLTETLEKLQTQLSSNVKGSSQNAVIQTDEVSLEEDKEKEIEIWREKIREKDMMLEKEREKMRQECVSLLDRMSAMEKDFLLLQNQHLQTLQIEIESKTFYQRQTLELERVMNQMKETVMRLEEGERRRDKEVVDLSNEKKELQEMFEKKNSEVIELSERLNSFQLVWNQKDEKRGEEEEVRTEAEVDEFEKERKEEEKEKEEEEREEERKKEESSRQENESLKCELANQLKANEYLREQMTELEEKMSQLERATLCPNTPSSSSSVSPSKLKRLNTKMIAPNYFIYDARLRDRFYDSGVIVYQILVLALDNVEWEVTRRYSAFKEIHDKINSKTSIVIGSPLTLSLHPFLPLSPSLSLSPPLSLSCPIS
jgi:hypothetical protein